MSISRNALLGLSVVLCLPLAAMAGPPSKEAKKREAAWKALEDARKAALETIFSLESYPDEDHGKAGQPLVDQKVHAVKNAFLELDPAIQADVAKVMKLPEAKKRAFLAAADAELNDWEKVIRRRIADLEVMKKNETVGAKKGEALPRGGVAPTDQEREQIRLTNEYRMLLGRAPLAIDARLVACAREHSAEMTKLDYFAHESPTAGMRSPSERAAKVGVGRVAIGENIAMGYDSAKAAFDGWYTSSGHHRNMLESDWASMGTGRQGEHWTQNFAGAPPKK
ncbi:MAG: CAP domain-containing protein [Planctomycetota bacterium]